jgi:hypothetical protein
MLTATPDGLGDDLGRGLGPDEGRRVMFWSVDRRASMAASSGLLQSLCPTCTEADPNRDDQKIEQGTKENGRALAATLAKADDTP